jgi:hypothetical protein
MESQASQKACRHSPPGPLASIFKMSHPSLGVNNNNDCFCHSKKAEKQNKQKQKKKKYGGVWQSSTSRSVCLQVRQVQFSISSN